MFKFLNFPKYAWFYCFLIFFLVIEAINKVYSFYVDQDIIIQKGFKLIATSAILLSLILKEPKKLIIPLILICWFSIGQLLLSDSFNNHVVLVFVRYFFFILLVIFFTEFPKLDDRVTKSVFKFWEGFLWLNNLLIILSFIFGFAIFKTYPGDRWGFNGLFMASANSTYFYLAAIMYFLIRYPKSYFKFISFWLSLIASFLMGTKSIYLGVLLFGLISLTAFKIPKKNKLVLIFCVVLVALGSIFLLFTSELFTKTIQDDGWISAILSYRDELFIEKTLPYLQQNWNIWQYFIGGLSDPFVRPQMEVIDLFLYFGGVGMLLYLYTFFKRYFNFMMNINQRALFIVLMLVPIISGNFLYNASVPIYLIFLKLVVINHNKISQEKSFLTKEVHHANFKS